MMAVVLAGCPSRNAGESTKLTAAERNAAIVAIAGRYAESQDKEAARIALDALNLPNPAQSVLALAEAQIVQNQDPESTRNLVALAQALGPISRMASEYLVDADETAGGEEVAVVAETPPPPTDTPVPTDTPTDTPEPTATSTDTPEPTATPTDTPVPAPRAVAESQGLNVRSGPGTLYPVVAEMRQGDEADILARNDDGSWWQVTLADGTEGWVIGRLVNASGDLDAGLGYRWNKVNFDYGYHIPLDLTETNGTHRFSLAWTF